MNKSHLLCAVVASAVAHAAMAETPERLGNISVQGRSDDLLGIADTATSGSTGSKQLSFRPFARPGEILETVPGLIITQHDGGGKANQYFLRGFNLDHGTDLATSVDGVPLNMPSHVHGQGYTDTNWLIPELVKNVQFEKGPFAPEYGDFSNAGHVEINYQNKLPENILAFEGGTLNYERILGAFSHPLGAGNLLYAIEASHFDGAWDIPDDYQKLNGIIRYSEGVAVGEAGSGYSLSAQGYFGKWVGSEQVPQRAIDSGLIGRYGSLDSSDGGLTHRISTYGEWHHLSEQSSTDVTVYLVNYALDLYSNFTYFVDPINGDQIQQTETRFLGGTSAKHTEFTQIGSIPSDHTVGVQYRQDRVDEDLNHTTARVNTSQVRSDSIHQQNIALWYANKTRWSGTFRTLLGARLDHFIFDDASPTPANSGNTSASAFSPKVSFVFGPFNKTELYVSFGEGLRSTDTRSLFTAQAQPADPSIRSLPPIIRSRGAEFGVRDASVEGLKSTLALWLLDTDSDTYFSGDSGTVEDAGRTGRRLGLEWTNYYEAQNWLMIDADFAFSQSRYTTASSTEPGDHIPQAVRNSVAAGVTVHDGPLCEACFVTLKLRYFGSRDLNAAGDQESAPSTVLNLAAGYPLARNFTLKAEILNLLNAKYNDAEYYSQSRLKGEAAGPDQGGTDDHMVHPGEPMSARLALIANF